MSQNISHIKVLRKSLSPKLYNNLLKQLNKDLLLGGIDLSFDNNCTPKDLVSDLTDMLKDLIQKKHQTFNQFMYTLDVSEKKIHSLNPTNIDELGSELARLVLERLLQKVILKEQFKS